MITKDGCGRGKFYILANQDDKRLCFLQKLNQNFILTKKGEKKKNVQSDVLSLVFEYSV